MWAVSGLISADQAEPYCNQKLPEARSNRLILTSLLTYLIPFGRKIRSWFQMHQVLHQMPCNELELPRTHALSRAMSHHIYQNQLIHYHFNFNAMWESVVLERRDRWKSLSFSQIGPRGTCHSEDNSLPKVDFSSDKTLFSQDSSRWRVFFRFSVKAANENVTSKCSLNISLGIRLWSSREKKMLWRALEIQIDGRFGKGDATQHHATGITPIFVTFKPRRECTREMEELR